MKLDAVALGVMFAAAAAAFAVTLSTPAAWVFVVAAIVSIFWRGLPELVPARRLLYVALGATVVFGWILMIYPVMSTETMRLWSITIGYLVGVLGCVFLLSEADGWRTSIPAAVGLLVVASFDVNAAIHPYLAVAWLATLLYLMVDVMPLSAGRAALSAGSALVAFGLGSGVVLGLPWLQGQVEEVMVAVYTPASDGVQAQHRSRLGELGSLKLSKKVVMRVWSERPQRLRSRVLIGFDGTGWMRDTATVRPLGPKPVERVHPNGRAFLDELAGVDFVTEDETLSGQRLIGTKVVRVDGEGIVTPGGSLIIRAPVEGLQVDQAGVVLLPPRTRLRVYGVLHEVNHQRAQRGPSPEAMLEASRQLPEGLDPRIRELSDALALGAVSDEDVVERVVAHLREGYHYSLDIGDVDPQNPLGDFLFEKKEGWCEYFASSAAVLARAQGIPTRYVRGFNVIGSQKQGDHYVVREWDRHAWIEAYIEGKGWLEYDPTPAAEYESLHAGLGDGVFTNALEWARMHFATLYASLRHFDLGRLVKPALFLVALFVALRLLVPLVRAWPRWGRRKRGGVSEDDTSSELDDLVRVLDHALLEIGWPRPTSRAPLEHWTTVPEEKLTPELRTTGLEVLRSYYRARFGTKVLSTEELQALRERTAVFRV